MIAQFHFVFHSQRPLLLAILNHGWYRKKFDPQLVANSNVVSLEVCPPREVSHDQLPWKRCSSSAGKVFAYPDVLEVCVYMYGGGGGWGGVEEVYSYPVCWCVCVCTCRGGGGRLEQAYSYLVCWCVCVCLGEYQTLPCFLHLSQQSQFCLLLPGMRHGTPDFTDAMMTVSIAMAT